MKKKQSIQKKKNYIFLYVILNGESNKILKNKIKEVGPILLWAHLTLLDYDVNNKYIYMKKDQKTLYSLSPIQRTPSGPSTWLRSNRVYVVFFNNDCMEMYAENNGTERNLT